MIWVQYVTPTEQKSNVQFFFTKREGKRLLVLW